MKTVIITPILILTLIIMASGGVFYYSFSKLIKTAGADGYSPMDFIENYKNFKIEVGVDKNNGRYYNYHYEFAD